MGGRPVHVRGRPGYGQRPAKEIFGPRNLDENSKVGLRRRLDVHVRGQDVPYNEEKCRLVCDTRLVVTP